MYWPLNRPNRSKLKLPEKDHAVEEMVVWNSLAFAIQVCLYFVMYHSQSSMRHTYYGLREAMPLKIFENLNVLFWFRHLVPYIKNCNILI